MFPVCEVSSCRFQFVSVCKITDWNASEKCMCDIMLQVQCVRLLTVNKLWCFAWASAGCCSCCVYWNSWVTSRPKLKLKPRCGSQPRLRPHHGHCCCLLSAKKWAWAHQHACSWDFLCDQMQRQVKLRRWGRESNNWSHSRFIRT